MTTPPPRIGPGLPPRPGTAAVPPAVRVLCVEDNPDDAELAAIALERVDPGRSYLLQRVEDEAGFRSALATPSDVVLCDFHLPSFSPYAALDILRELGDDTPLVVVTRAIGEDAAVKVLRAGARDYVTKDRLGTLPAVIARVMAERRVAADKARLAAELDAAYQRLKELSGRLVMAQEQERARIARELHEQLGQGLAALGIHLHAARRAGSGEAFEQHAAIAEELASGTLARLKALSVSLRPAQFDLLGLAAGVESAVQRLAEPAGLAFQVSVRGIEQPGHRPSAAAVVLRLAQDAVCQALQRDHASLLLVRLRFRSDGRLGLLVLDDGAVLEDGASTQDDVHLGDLGMQVRAELAGGRLRQRRSRGRGTAVRALL